jgi:hypothetical protein
MSARVKKLIIKFRLKQDDDAGDDDGLYLRGVFGMEKVASCAKNDILIHHTEI